MGDRETGRFERDRPPFLRFSPSLRLAIVSCLLPSAVCRLATAVYRLRTGWQSLLQNLFLRPLDRHAVSLTVFVDGPVFEHVVPLIAYRFDFPQRVLWLFQPRAGDSA